MVTDLKTRSFLKYREARDAAGLNNAQVADAAKIPSSTIYDWAAGRYMPKADKLAAIGKVLGKSVEYFIE